MFEACTACGRHGEGYEPHPKNEELFLCPPCHEATYWMEGGELYAMGVDFCARQGIPIQWLAVRINHFTMRGELFAQAIRYGVWRYPDRRITLIADCPSWDEALEVPLLRAMISSSQVAPSGMTFDLIQLEGNAVVTCEEMPLGVVYWQA